MGLEQNLWGTTFIVAGVLLAIFANTVWAGLTFFIIGLGLILFTKSEDKIEKRRDKKSQKK